MPDSQIDRRPQPAQPPDWKLGAVGCLLALAASLPRPLAAQVDWSGAASNDWFVAGNWAGGVPTAGDDALVDTLVPNPAVIAAPGAEAQSVIIAPTGSGSLALRDGGSLTLGAGGGDVGIAAQAGSTGTLFIGGGSTDPADAAATGALNADSVVFGDGTGTLIFNHTGVGYLFGPSIEGTGTVRIVAGVTELAGDNTYTGPTILTGGTLSAIQDTSLSSDSDFTVGTGAVLTIDMNVTAEIASLTGAGSVVIGNNSQLYIVGNETSTFSGAITGDGDLGFEGSGSLTLTGTSSIDGSLSICSCGDAVVTIGGGGSFTASSGTEVSGGRLVLADGGLLITDDLVADDGTVRVSGAGSRITASGATSIGLVSGGVLEIADGGVLNSLDDAQLDSVSGTSTAAVTGSGSRWNVTGTLSIGEVTFGNVAEVDVAGGGVVAATGRIDVGDGSTLRLGTGGLAGALETPVVANKGQIIANFIDASTLSAAVSGVGSLSKSGSGTLTLTGNNSYTGGTTVSGGVLEIGTGGVLPGNVTNNAVLSFNHADTQSYGGIISGSGAVRKAGGGVLVLSGVNTYGGLTAVDGGTMRLAGGAAIPDNSAVTVASGAVLDLAGTDETIGSLAGAGAVTLGAGRLTAGGNGASTEFSGVLSGDGRLNKTGAGTLTLTGANSYTGGTTVADGVLEVGTGGVLPGDVANAATLSFNHGDDKAFAGVVSGGGTLVKTGGGTLVLTGANSHTGGTTISGGVLEIGTGGVLPGDVTNNAFLAFNHSDAQNYIGIVSGSGGLTKAGSGVLTLSGGNTYGGATSVDGGTLRLSGGAALPDGSAVTVASGAVLDLAGTHEAVGSLAGGGSVTLGAGRLTAGGNDASTEFSGVLSGTGGLTKTGGGTLILSGVNSHTGVTRVEAGRLIVVGSIAGPVEVGALGTLGGTGRLDGGLVATGTLAPGNSIGTLTVAGDLSFSPGSVYEVEVDPRGSASDLIRIGGRAFLDGARVVHVGEIGEYRPFASYTILTADGGLSGRFDGVGSNFTFLNSTLRYDPSNVYLTLVRNDDSFASVGETRNQAATAAGVESAGAGAAVYDAVVVLPNEATARTAFDALSGEVHASLRGTLLEDGHVLRGAAGDRLRAAQAGPAAPAYRALAADTAAVAETPSGIATWVKALGSRGSRRGDGNAATLDRSLGGVLIGADVGVGDAWRIGFLTGYDRRDLDVDDRRSSATVDSVHLGLYAGTEIGPFSLGFGATVSRHSIDAGRTVSFSGLNERLEADYDATTGQVFGEAAYSVGFGRVAIQPFVGLAHARAEIDGFREGGGDAALRSDSASEDLTYGTVGVRAASRLDIDGLPPMTASGSLGWRHAFGDTTPTARLAFSGGDGFTLHGAPVERDAAVIRLGLDLDVAENARLGVAYDGRIGDRAQDHGISVGFSLRF